MYDYYSVINLQGLRSNIYIYICLDFISKKNPCEEKHEIRHMLVLNIVSLKTLNEKT